MHKKRVRHTSALIGECGFDLLRAGGPHREPHALPLHRQLRIMVEIRQKQRLAAFEH